MVHRRGHVGTTEGTWWLYSHITTGVHGKLHIANTERAAGINTYRHADTRLDHCIAVDIVGSYCCMELTVTPMYCRSPIQVGKVGCGKWEYILHRRTVVYKLTGIKFDLFVFVQLNNESGFISKKKKRTRKRGKHFSKG